MPAPPTEMAKPRSDAPIAELRRRIDRMVKLKSLHGMYPPARQEEVVAKLSKVDWRGFAAAWRLPLDKILDLAPLALYDAALFLDDSG